ncbi:hypothetical protein, conserved [Leishmania tarentolae]|uniref:Uncharacterized protein n=1 Tax=Leishmania tarentolae TaxID=5689 RepID=A0A640KH52_LEITA|nr:hypothetical protein, conserved [Leishmania tarentolae]
MGESVIISQILLLAFFASCSLTYVTTFTIYWLLVLLHQYLCIAGRQLLEAPLVLSHFLNKHMESVCTVIANAAKEMDQILDAGAHLYLQSIKTTGAPSIRAAFGFSEQPLKLNQVVCLTEISRVEESTTKNIDFPVLVDRRVVTAMKTFFVRSFQREKGTLSKATDASPEVQDSLHDSPHVTRTMLSDMHPTIIALAWACIPQHDTFVSFRRRRLRETCFTADDKADVGERLHCVIKEFVLLDLLLSLCPKLKLLWEYRQWLCSSMHNCGLLNNSKEDNDVALPILQFEAQDDQLFFVAAHNHTMNYNAWHYRRLRFQTLHANASKLCARRDCACVAVQRDSERVIQFIREHSSDSSATSYLLFLLHEQEVLDRKGDAFLSKEGVVVEGPSEAAGELHRSSTKEYFTGDTEDSSRTPVSKGSTRYALAPALWKNFMKVTQTEIRRHTEKGHECIWQLRLGLIQWACSRSPESRMQSLWSVEDELRWTSTYLDIHLVDGVDALLCPVSPLPYAWAESFGSSAWTSFNASRYGRQLALILRNTLSCERL